MRTLRHTGSPRVTRSACAAAISTLVLAACGGGGNQSAASSDTAAAPPATSAAAPAAATPATGGQAAGGPALGAMPTGATAAMAALGDSIFHGQAGGGLCFTCHGADAKGTTLAPNLTDQTWLTGDGSYAMIQKRVSDGMPTPTPPYAAPMLPMGGAQLTQPQIAAVAAYVYSISHPK